MASFAERMGAVSPRSELQIQHLDVDTKVDIWNVLHLAREHGSGDTFALKTLWSRHWRQPLDRFGSSATESDLRLSVLNGNLIESLGTTEAYLKALSQSPTEPSAEQVAQALNGVFSENLVGYRFVGLELVPVTEEAEVTAIEEALSDVGPYKGAHDHLINALRFLSDRTNPQYAKSVAESISAVEAIVTMMTGQSTLGKGLGKLKAKGFVIHGALEQAWSSLYGYTSDEHGVRHGSIEGSDVDEKLATYMLVTCSAFVSLLLKVESETKSY